MLLTDSHLSNLNLDWDNRHSVAHSHDRYARGAACTNATEGLWTGVKRVLDVDHSWYRDRSLSHWLDGLRWRENHRHLCHRERMWVLAEEMRWKRPIRIHDQFRPQQGMIDALVPAQAGASGETPTAMAAPHKGFGTLGIPRATPYKERATR